MFTKKSLALFALTSLFLSYAMADDCVIINVNEPLYAGNLDNKIVHQLSNDDFANTVTYNDKRKRIFISYKSFNGWIDENALLCNAGNSGLFNAISRNPSLPISLKKKALLATNIESLKDIELQGGNAQQAQDLQVNIYYSPSQEAKYISTQAKLFQVRYIYKQLTVDGKDFFLVGLNESTNVDNIKNVLQGWVGEDKVLEWDNRIGLEFNTADDAQSKIYLDPKQKTIKYTEQSKDKMQYYEPRFPLLRKINKDTFRIGFIGGADNGKITRSEIAKAKQSVNEVIQNNQLQIAIVIDATSGMKPYFQDVVDATKEFLDITKQKANVDIAITVFRDYADGKDIYSVIKNFKEEKNINLDNIATKSNALDNGVGAYPEALFYSIDASIKALNWSKKNIEKYMIVIGDHGNHPDSSQYKQEKQFSTLSIGNQLKDKLVTLWGIQVSSKASGTNVDIKQSSLSRFPTQINEIIAHNKNSSGKVTSYKRATKDDIRNTLVKIYNNFAAIKVALSDLNRENTLQEKTGFSAAILKRLGIDPKIFGQITQATSTGYINRYDKGFTQKVLIKKRDLERLKTSINSLSGTLFRGSYHDELGQRQIKNTVIRIFQDLTGDTIKEDENIRRFIFSKTALPVQTKALQQSINRLIRKCANKDYRVGLVKELEAKYIKIHGVLMEKELNLGKFNVATGKYSFTEGADKKYFYNLEQPIESKKGIIDNSQVLHSWVPIELFP